jgi:hypothetical protein
MRATPVDTPGQPVHQQAQAQRRMLEQGRPQRQIRRGRAIACGFYRPRDEGLWLTMQSSF